MEFDVAIIGMACVFPKAPDLPTFWRNICEGVDAITDVPPDRWDPLFYDPASSAPDRVYARRGGFIDEYALFDAARFGLMPKAAKGAEPDQLLALQVAADALADAGYADRPFARDKTSIVVGRGHFFGPAHGAHARRHARRAAARRIAAQPRARPLGRAARGDQARLPGTLRSTGRRHGDRSRAEPARVARREPARSLRFRVHARRGLRERAGGRRPCLSRAAARQGGRRACRRGPPVSRRGVLERLLATRRAVAPRSRSARSTAMPTACSSARASACSC